MSSPIAADRESFTLTSGLDPQELRYSLLFWDDLAWPTSNIIHVAGGQDEEFLEGAGILSRPRVEMSGLLQGGGVVGLPHLEAFYLLDAQEPDKWSLATGEKSFSWSELPLSAAEGALLELHRAIPVPDREVPLQDILEFKQKRRDELVRLRAEIESYVSEVRAAADSESALRGKSRHVEQACVDLLRVGIEWQFPMRLADLKATFEVKPGEAIFKALGATAISRFAFDLGAVATLLGTAVGIAAGSGLKISGTPQWVGFKPRPTPLQYVQSFHKELF